MLEGIKKISKIDKNKRELRKQLNVKYEGVLSTAYSRYNAFIARRKKNK